VKVGWGVTVLEGVDVDWGGVLDAVGVGGGVGTVQAARTIIKTIPIPNSQAFRIYPSLWKLSLKRSF
jgi:hypothetical protein